MRKPIFSQWLLILSIVISQSVLAGEGRVGDIQYSILTENQFQQLHGPEWELLRGQTLPLDSELRDFWANSHLPDARGVFLRCSNHGRTRHEGNPDGNLAIGVQQQDQFQLHKHGGGNHNHQIECEHNASRACGGTCNTMALGYHHRSLPSTFSANIITAEGGPETRPRCITVNAFIKIKETPEDPAPRVEAQVQWTQEQVANFLNTPQFKNALTHAVQNARNSNGSSGKFL